MNKTRRNVIWEIRDRLEQMKDEVEDLKEQINTPKDEEQEYADNMPENMQSSDRHEKAETAVSCMDRAMDALYDVMDQLDIAIGELKEAAE